MHILSFNLVMLSVLFVTKAETHDATVPKTKCSGKEKASTLLDVARDFMNKAKYFYPDCIEDDSNCGKKEKSLAFLEVAANLVTEVKKNFPTCPETDCPEVVHKPMDCSEVLQGGYNESGVYTIWPRSRVYSGKPLDVYCDMDTDGGGWTVIQRRGSFTTPKDYFFKDWASYKIGFGDIKEEFWIGNDNMHAISNQAKNAIRFDLKDAAGIAGYAVYNSFWIDDENSKYTLHIQGYSGNVGDAMDYHNSAKFTTKDRNNDGIPGNCALNHDGAWWYVACLSANLNGLYQPGVESRKGIVWDTWRKNVGLSSVEIKLRPLKVGNENVKI